MKKIAFLAFALIALSACKKDKTEEVIVQNTYVVNTYVSDVPLYSVVVHNDTLTCDAENTIYEYTKISDSQFISSRVYWKSTQNWTTWNQGAISYFSNDTLYVHI